MHSISLKSAVGSSFHRHYSGKVSKFKHSKEHFLNKNYFASLPRTVFFCSALLMLLGLPAPPAHAQRNLIVDRPSVSETEDAQRCYKYIATFSAIAFPSNGGTALPICLTICVLLP